MKNFPLVILFIFLMGNSSTFAYQSTANLKFNTSLMEAMLSNSTPFNNEFILLQSKASLSANTMYVGGYAQGGVNYVYANKKTYFYSDNLTYRSRDYVSLDRAALALFANPNSWSGVYFEAGATDLGEPYTSSLKINQGYLLLGDNKFPLFGFMGYKNIDFGNFSTVNLFAQPTTRWDYAGTAMTLGAGFTDPHYNLTVSLLREGTQGAEDYYGAGLWRVYLYPNYYTAQKPNFAINANYHTVTNTINWNIGAGYIRGLWLGSPANNFNNATIGAWDINTQIHIQPFTLLAEFVKSTPRTSSFGNFIPENSSAVFLQTWDVGIQYQLPEKFFSHPSKLSADISQIVGNNSFANATQWVVGFSNELSRYIKIGAEYACITQTSNQGANRSGLFYRAHHNVQVLQLGLIAHF